MGWLYNDYITNLSSTGTELANWNLAWQNQLYLILQNPTTYPALNNQSNYFFLLRLGCLMSYDLKLFCLILILISGVILFSHYETIYQGSDLLGDNPKKGKDKKRPKTLL